MAVPERLAQQAGLLEADLGEAGVLHGSAVTVPLGLAVADEDELHRSAEEGPDDEGDAHGERGADHHVVER